MAPTLKNDGLLSIKGFYPESFDRILLDPPCSALGLRPKLRIDAQSVSQLMKVEAYQRLFVRNAIALLKPGGILAYSTCTINACENEQMVRHILDVYPCMILLPIDADIGTPGLPGMGLSDSERCMVKRFDPSHISDTMGFFVAKFKKST
jgi:16S rRNA C967 or C1407 C5-methylase (RsmB/RsmF family)